MISIVKTSTEWPGILGGAPAGAVGQPDKMQCAQHAQCVRVCEMCSAVYSARGARATFAYASAPWRDVQLPLIALHHHLHGLGPPAYHLVGRELGGLAPVVRAVELVAARVVGGGAALIVAEAPTR